MAVSQRQLPEHLVHALDEGFLTQEQLQQLIAIEAEELGLTFDEAVERAHQNTLPKTPLGSDLQFLAMMLAE